MNKLLLLLLLSISILGQGKKGFLPLKPEGGNAPEGTESRLALVVGNKDYTYINKLKNPINDALAMSAALKNLGFEVIEVSNADYRALLAGINRFKEKLSDSDVAFFYYSGHGLSYGGKNYLLPIDTDISCLEQIEDQGISLSRILGEIASKKVKNSFVVLDACRNLPNLKVCDASKKDLFTNVGLVKPTNNPRGSLVVYATEEGSTADDNPKANNGLFTGVFLKYLTIPNLTIKTILDKTSLEVENISGGLQSPGRYDKIFGDFYFVVNDKTNVPVSPPVIIPVKKPDLLPFEPAMVSVKGGTFEMGSNDDIDFGAKPVYQVRLSDYSIGKYEITVGEYLAFCDATKSHYPEWLEVGSEYHIETGSNTLYKSKGYDRSSINLPIVGISWDDAVAYCQWLSDKTDKMYRLPTEAEWEYAARGGQGSLAYTYAGSNTAENVGWVYGNSSSKPHKVGLKIANELGIYDMSGNVWEWCSDWYGAYSSVTQTNPKGPSTGTYRVLRGGSWLSDPQDGRVAYRDYYTPGYRSNRIGFRVVSPQ